MGVSLTAPVSAPSSVGRMRAVGPGSVTNNKQRTTTTKAEPPRVIWCTCCSNDRPLLRLRTSGSFPNLCYHVTPCTGRYALTVDSRTNPVRLNHTITGRSNRAFSLPRKNPCDRV